MAQVPPPTERCQKIVKKLEILTILELVFSIVSLYVSYDLFFYMIFSCLVLYLGYTQLDFCSIMYFIFFCIIQLFDLALSLAQLWSTTSTGMSQQLLILYLVFYGILIAFNIIAMVIACEAYQEFKIIALAQERDNLYSGFGRPGFGGGLFGGGYGNGGYRARRQGYGYDPYYGGIGNNLLLYP